MYSVGFEWRGSRPLGRGLQLCLPSVGFVAALLYVSVFPFGVGGLVWV